MGGRRGTTGIGKEAYQVRIKYVSGAVMHKTSSLVESARRASCAHRGNRQSREDTLGGGADNAAIYGEAAGDCAPS